MFKLCKKCGFQKTEESFTFIKSGKKAGTRYSYCRECERKTDRERQDKLWKNRKHKDKTSSIRTKNWKARNPEKVVAQKLAQKNIPFPEGILCQSCHENKATDRHHQDYSKPLDIVFLCVSCHAKTRRKDDFARPDTNSPQTKPKLKAVSFDDERDKTADARKGCGKDLGMYYPEGNSLCGQKCFGCNEIHFCSKECSGESK